MSSYRKSPRPYLAFAAILLLLSLAYYAGIIFRLPFGVHEWAQGDRLSLAINFYDNGLNFFRPATHSLYSTRGITGVEFPVQSYIAGALGYIFGRDAINTCFRLEGIVIACAGLWFLFRAVYDRTSDFVLSAVPPLVIFSSPVFVCYTAAYLPDPAGVSTAFIAFYVFLQYADSRALRKLIISLAIMTLAVLIKASIAAYFAGIACYGLYREIVVRRSVRRALVVLGAAVASVAIVLGQISYIRHLNATYHSNVFLVKIRPFSSRDEFYAYRQFLREDILLQKYFPLAVYPLMAVIIAIGIYRLRKATSRSGHYLLPVPVFLAGAITLCYLFGGQLTLHDYYVLAIGFPLIAYLLVVSAVALHRHSRPGSLRAIHIGVAATLVFILFVAGQQVYERFHLAGRYRDNYSSYWLAGGALLLDSLKVPAEEHILVAGEIAPNLALVYFDRKGYVMPPDSWHTQLEPATRFLQEKSLRYLIFKAADLKNIIATDSIELGRYDIMAVTKDKAVLRLKM